MIATEMFLTRGFDAVTVAAAVGVSKVTVFAHFDRKEDILLDRLPEAVDLIRRLVRDRGVEEGVLEVLHRGARSLAAERHPLLGLRKGSEPMLRTMIGSPALLARLRTFELDVEQMLAGELYADRAFVGDPALTAALLVAAYRTVAVATVQRPSQARRLTTWRACMKRHSMPHSRRWRAASAAYACN